MTLYICKQWTGWSKETRKKKERKRKMEADGKIAESAHSPSQIIQKAAASAPPPCHWLGWIVDEYSFYCVFFIFFYSSSASVAGAGPLSLYSGRIGSRHGRNNGRGCCLFSSSSACPFLPRRSVSDKSSFTGRPEENRFLFSRRFFSVLNEDA